MRSKKGESTFSQLWEIAQVIILVTVATSGMMYVRDLATDTFIEKQYVTMDSALLMSLAMSAPGNIAFPYPKDLSKLELDYEIGNGRVKIKTIGDDAWTSYRYAIDHTVDFQTFEKSKISALFLSKNGNEFSVDSSPLLLKNQLQCPEADTKDIMWKSKPVYFNFSQDLQDNFLYLQSYSTSFSDQYDPDIHDMIISVHTDEKSEGIKAYVDAGSTNYVESQKLGCMIINELLKDYEANYTVVILTDLETETNEKATEMLKIGQGNDKINTYIEIGETDSRISTRIYEAMEKYFENEP